MSNSVSQSRGSQPNNQTGAFRSHLKAAMKDFTHHSYPLARIKKVFGNSSDVRDAAKLRYAYLEAKFLSFANADNYHQDIEQNFDTLYS
jgi:hypothetical protein